MIYVMSDLHVAGCGQAGVCVPAASAQRQRGEGDSSICGFLQCSFDSRACFVLTVEMALQVDRLGSEVLWREAARISAELEPLYGLLQVLTRMYCPVLAHAATA